MSNEPNLMLAKKLNLWAYALTVLILGLIGMMRRVKIDVGMDLSFLAGANAAINTVTTILLLVAFIQIKKKNIAAHRKAIYAAMVSSVLFLLCYVGYHFTTEETTFCKEGMIRNVYYFVLITHVILAGVIFPFILFTFIKAYTHQIEAHRRMAKKVWPIWFYVSITGPIVYLMLRPCYS